MLVYDIAVYDINLYPTDLRWNVFEELTEEQADLKARRARRTPRRSRGGTHPMNSVKSIAPRSATCGCRLAEQYALVRQVRR